MKWFKSIKTMQKETHDNICEITSQVKQLLAFVEWQAARIKQLEKEKENDMS